MGYGYTVTNSIDMINTYCSNPAKYKSWQIRKAINDAKTHYENGNASKSWYDYVTSILTPYL